MFVLLGPARHPSKQVLQKPTSLVPGSGPAGHFPRCLWKCLLIPPGRRKGILLYTQEDIHVLSKFQMDRRGLEVDL